MTSHTDTDTIFRKVDDQLIPEYVFNLTGFDKTLKLWVGQVVMSDSYAFLRIVYDNRSYFIAIDLESNRPLIHLRQLFDQDLTIDNIPKPMNEGVFYSIRRNKDSIEEKNPMILFYRLKLSP
ncbi:hypothetical protein MM239_10155 [Belliella sp. DSM 111904]|uniref:Uncharacterized protein n=1 Tax=Belliella filtrata TaxID=2923435 RepID=A0ABS9V021_9BACT|nr:hypothetical protein [Belliella filtrata]MCH7409757.1 hypothetical protein [Belliella filtrata]